MNSFVDSYFTIREKTQSFNNSLVISVGLFIVIIIVTSAVENILYQIENRLISLDNAGNWMAKITIWFVELIAINLIFFSLGSFLFSSIASSYYVFYQITFILNLIFTLLRFSLKLYYLVKPKS